MNQQCDPNPRFPKTAVLPINSKSSHRVRNSPLKALSNLPILVPSPVDIPEGGGSEGTTGSQHSQPAASADQWSLVMTSLWTGDRSRCRSLVRPIERLAVTWGKDAQSSTRRLALSYTEPMGQLTRPEKSCLLLQDNVPPIREWEELVIGNLRLTGRRVKFQLDEQETQIVGHPE